jgi:hypothetical protein
MSKKGKPSVSNEKIAEKSGKKSEKIEIIHFMPALFSGSMSGSSAYTIKGQVLNHLRVLGGTTVNQNTYIYQALVRSLAGMLGRT